MKATHNPYNPGAGVPPPELAGRDNLVEIARVFLSHFSDAQDERFL